MQRVTVTGNNKTANRLRVLIDGVQIMSLPQGEKRTVSKTYPARWHVLSWCAMGEQGETYAVKIDSPAGEQCNHDGAIDERGFDCGDCPFIVF